ncbi:MAG: DUF72 domain-containing protein [Armatimonadota bacterium]
MADIRLGTSGYSYDHWKGKVYPSTIKNSEMFLYYINQYRPNSVEINYTYYKQPSAKVFEYYVKNSPKDFDVVVKLFGGITHKSFKSIPPIKADKTVCTQFLEGIKPLAESGKLGCLLAQFPESLKPSSRTWGYLHSIQDEMGDLPLVYEFRNKEWISEKNLVSLKLSGIGFCVVDEPKLGELMPLYPAVTSDIAYLRLHGRNPNWYTNPDFRYDYLYSEEELSEFIPIIEKLSSESKVMYIFFNNCHAGSALRNVKMMQNILGMGMLPMQGILF